MQQTWRVVHGWPSYEVSDLGNVRSVDGVPTGQWENSKGYMIVRLRQPRAMARVHRLVAAAFLAPAHTQETVNHKDGDKQNNQASNLEWATRRENTLHAISNWLGAYSPPRLYGENHPRHKLTDEAVRDALLCREAGEPFRQIARRLGVDRTSLKRRFPKPPVQS